MLKFFMTTALTMVLATPALSEATNHAKKDSGIKNHTPPGPVAAGSPTRVQQLTAKLAHQLEELEEYPNNTYYGPASVRTARSLAAATAAQAAGTPLPPLFGENGTVIPLSRFDDDYTDAVASIY